MLYIVFYFIDIIISVIKDTTFMSRVDNVEFNASNNKLLIDIKDIYLINQRPDESNENFIAEYWQNCFGFVFQIYPQWTRIADIQLNFCSFYRINFMLYLCYLWKLIFSILILLSQNVILCIATKMNLIAVTIFKRYIISCF